MSVISAHVLEYLNIEC